MPDSHSYPLFCPACQAPDPEKYTPIITKLASGRKLHMDIYRCPSCRHRFLPTTPEEQRLIEEYYDDDYAGFREDQRFRSVVKTEIETNFLPRIAAPASVLDCGCGNGTFLEEARSAGYQVCGIDVSESAASLCREKGLEVVSGDYLSHPFAPSSFDFITMWDVVEHLRNPRDFMLRSQQLLKKEGWLVLKIPAFGDLTFGYLSIKPNLAGVMLGAPDHVQYFQENSLRTLLEETGFHNITFYERGGFRQVRESTSVKQALKRKIKRILIKTGGNHNLYVFAQPR